jgi:hypothetical protein
MPINESMSSRRPGQLVIEKLLAEQRLIRRRSPLARFFGVSPLGPASRSWYVGALGEIAVGRILESLPAGWTAFHALPIGTGGSDVDHVVAGPGGVFALNTKHHAGKKIWVSGRGLLVNGQSTHYISNSEAEAKKITAILRRWAPQAPEAQPVIVLVDPSEISIKKRPDRVEIMDARRLRRWLMKRPTSLDLEQCAGIVRHLDDPSLWRLEPSAADNSAELFTELDREVRSARARQRLWFAVAAVIVIGGSICALLWAAR